MSPSIVPHPPGEEPKPVRDLLEDIHRRSGYSQGPRGIVNPRIVDKIAFGATVLTVIACAATLLTMVWEGIDHMFSEIRVMSSVLERPSCDSHVPIREPLVFRGILIECTRRAQLWVLLFEITHKFSRELRTKEAVAVPAK